MSHLNKNRKGWEIYMYIIFDLGLIGVVILVLTVLGITTVGALGHGLQKISKLFWR